MCVCVCVCVLTSSAEKKNSAMEEARERYSELRTSPGRNTSTDSRWKHLRSHREDGLRVCLREIFKHKERERETD